MVGLCIVASKVLVQRYSPVMILCVRFAIASLLLLAMHFIFSKAKLTPLKQLTTKDWIFIVLQALCAGAFFNILLLIGLHYTSALPAIIAILSILFLKEKLTRNTMLYISLAVFRLILINTHNLNFNGNHHLLGSFFILLSLLPEATYYILSKIHRNKLPIFLVSCLMNLINLPILFIILSFNLGHSPLVISHQSLLLFLLLGLGSGLFYVFWFLSCKKVPGSLAGMTTAFMPIATLIIATIFLGEQVTEWQLAGMLCIIAYDPT